MSLKDTLLFVLDHLKRVALRCDANKMSTASLATNFGPILLCPAPAECAKMGVSMDFKKHIEVLKYLLDVWPKSRGTSQVREHAV